jgi:hypothetical protein
MVQYAGAGEHEINLFFTDPEKLILFAKMEVASTTMIILSLAAPRFTTLIIYLRIFTNKTARTITWAVLATTLIYTIIGLIINLTVCIPLSSLWDLSITNARCINKEAWWGYGTIPVLFFDIVTMALPVPTIMQLSLPFGERMGLLATCLAYAGGTAAEIARIVAFNTYNGAGLDATWATVPLVYATECEIGTYLIAACIPGLRPLLLMIQGKGQYSKKSQGYYRSGKSDRSGQTPLGAQGASYGYRLDSMERSVNHEPMEKFGDNKGQSYTFNTSIAGASDISPPIKLASSQKIHYTRTFTMETSPKPTGIRPTGR